MSILEDITKLVNKVGQTISDFINMIIDFTKSPEGQAVTKACVEIVALISLILEKVNPKKRTGDQKREDTRLITRFVQSAPVDMFDRLAELKRTGELDKLTYEQLDALIVTTIAVHVDEKKDTKRAGKTEGG